MKCFYRDGDVHAYRIHYISLPDRRETALAMCGASTREPLGTLDTNGITCPACRDALNLGPLPVENKLVRTVPIGGRLLRYLWRELDTGRYILRYDYGITGQLLGPTPGAEDTRVDLYVNTPQIYGLASVPTEYL